MNGTELQSLGQSVRDAFGDLPDPRAAQRRHPLLNIVTIALIAVIAGADDCTEFEQFGWAKYSWLETFLDLSHGIPSHDTFSRTFALLDPTHWQSCFVDWVRFVLKGQLEPGDTLALDGKCLRGAGEQAVYLVNAWSSAQGLCLAQTQIAEKSNEITALPGLLETLSLLDLQGCTVTVDAMGTQREVARSIVAKQADYLMALKANQPSLSDDVQWLFAQPRDTQGQLLGLEHAETRATQHGREEHRQAWVISDIAYLAAHAWPGLQAVVCLRSQRTVRGKTTVEQRFFLSSAPLTAQSALERIRAHWEVENKLHWVLDVLFKEDRHRARLGHGPANLGVLRQLALNLLRRTPSPPRVTSLKGKRKRAAWDTSFLEQVLALL
jgi:predicted transposase YbfD/YdcC